MDLQRFKANLALRLFAWRYIPVIGFCAPVIEEMNAKALRIRKCCCRPARSYSKFSNSSRPAPRPRRY